MPGFSPFRPAGPDGSARFVDLLDRRVALSLVSIGALAIGIAGCASGPASPVAFGIPLGANHADGIAQAFNTGRGSGSYLERRQMTREQAMKHHFVFISDGKDVEVFQNDTKPPTQVGAITTGIAESTELAVDRDGTLYVANQLSGNVTVYPLGATSPSLTISTGLSRALIGVAVDLQGTVYASGGSSVYEYLKGTTTPSATITAPAAGGLALDVQENLYVAGLGVYEIPYGSTTLQHYPLNGLMVDPLGIAIAKDGTLYVGGDDRYGLSSVLVYKLGNPDPIRAIKFSYFDVYQLGLDHGGNLLVGLGGSPTFEVFHRHRSKPFETIATTYGNLGAAAYPPQ